MVRSIINNFSENKNSIISGRLNIKNLIGNKRNIILFIISILISKVGLIAGVNPFGIAILGAMASNGIALLLPTIIIAVTTLLAFGWLALLKFCISVVIFGLLKSFIKYGDNKTGDTVKILFSTAIAEAIAFLISGGLLYDGLLAIYQTLTSGIFFLVFSSGIEYILGIGDEKIFSTESLIATGITLAIAISGIGDISIFNISIRGVISVLIVLLLGWKKGASIGAASGIAISIVLAMIGIGNIATIATYGFGGLLAGIFSRYGRIGATIGFILGNVVLAFYANGYTSVIVNIKEIVVASIALLVIPKNVSTIIDNFFDYDASLTEGAIKGYLPRTTLYRLSAVSEVVSNMANATENVKVENSDEIGSFIKTLNENTCKRCSNYDKCWGNNYHCMYETVFNGIELLQKNGEIRENEISCDICDNKELLADGMNFSYQIYKVNKNWQQKMKEKHVQVSNQLKGVSKVIDKIREDAEITPNELIIPKGKYTLELGLSKIKKSSSNISGDNTIMLKLKNGKYIFGVSDGMGSGEEANRNSKQVIDMLEKLLNNGFEKEDALNLVNSVMNFNNEDSFATLDLSTFDTITGNAEFVKVSACPTYIKKNNCVDIVQSVSLPVGILDNADIDLYDKKLEYDDFIVMVTDGVLDANKEDNEKGKWLLDLLKAIHPDNPQRLADIILQEAIDSNFGIAQDDMTVLIAKVLPIKAER